MDSVLLAVNTKFCHTSPSLGGHVRFGARAALQQHRDEDPCDHRVEGKCDPVYGGYDPL